MTKKKILLLLLFLITIFFGFMYLWDQKLKTEHVRNVETARVDVVKADLNPHEEDTIVEGHGWKNIVLGATKDNVVNAVGEPSEILNYSDVYFYNYYPLGIQINFSRASNIVKAIFFYNKQHDSEQFSVFTKGTNKGIGFDNLADDVIQKYGKPQNNYSGNDKGIDWRRIEYSNIDFRFENGKMVRISVR